MTDETSDSAASARWRRSTAGTMQDGPATSSGTPSTTSSARSGTDPASTSRERRLLLIGLLGGQGADDVNSIQLEAAYARGELDADALREIVIFLAHYAGWPVGARLNMVVEGIIGKHSGSMGE